MDKTNSHRDELDVVRSGVPGMKPTSKPLPDFWRAETPAPAPPQAALFTNNSVLLLIFGILVGLFSGFSLGISANPTLVSGR